MQQEMAVPEHRGHLGAGNLAHETDPIGDPGLTRERSQPPALRAVAHDPVFGARQRRRGESAQAQSEAAAPAHPADADQTDRLFGRRGQACERIDLLGTQARAAAQLDPSGAERLRFRRRVPGHRQDDRAPPRGQPDPRIPFGDAAPERAQPGGRPSGPVATRAKARGRRFAAAKRAPDERHRQQRQEARGRVVRLTDVMGDVEPDLGMQAPGGEIRPDLPEIGPGRLSGWPGPPARQPPLAVDVAKSHMGQRGPPELGRDRRLVTAVGQDPDLVVFGDLPDDRPAEPELQFLARTAGVSREQNPHGREMPPGSGERARGSG